MEENKGPWIKKLFRAPSIPQFLMVDTIHSVYGAGGFMALIWAFFFGPWAVQNEAQENHNQLIAKIDSLQFAFSEEVNILKEQLDWKEKVNLPPFYGDSVSRDRYRQAQLFFHEQHYQRSLNILNQLVATNETSPDMGYAIYWKAENHYQLGNYSDVIESANKVIDLKSVNSQKELSALYLLGAAHQKRFEQEGLESDRNQSKMYYESLLEASKHNVCQPIFEKAKRNLSSLALVN